jgi:hypothetical protein
MTQAGVSTALSDRRLPPTATAAPAKATSDQPETFQPTTWPQVEACFDKADRQIRQAIIDHQYAKARDLIDRLRPIIQSNRRQADPLSSYTDMMLELGALRRYTDEAERRFNRMRATPAASPIQTPDRSAPLVEKSVRPVDLPVPPPPQRTVGSRQVVEPPPDARRLSLPHGGQIIAFPKDWRQITARRLPPRRAGGTRILSDEDLYRALDRPVARVGFDNVGLADAIYSLRDQQGINVIVRWRVLEAAGIDRDTPVTVEKMRNVPLGDVLEAVLAEASPEPGQLAYTVHKRIVTISTKDDLEQLKVTRRYDVTDLAQDVPNFIDALSGVTGVGGYGGGAGQYGTYGSYGGQQAGAGRNYGGGGYPGPRR